MSEDALWDNVRKKMAPFGRLTRIENRCDKGTPDVAYTLRGVSGWCELKHRPEWPAESFTPLVLPKLTLEQVTWAEEERRAGGHVGMLLQVGADYVFADAPLTRLIYEREITRGTLLLQYKTRMLTSRVLDRKWLLWWLTL